MPAEGKSLHDRRVFLKKSLALAAGAALLGAGRAEETAPIPQPEQPTPAHFIARAFALAREGASRREGTPYGCVIVKGGRIVGQAWNRAYANNDPTVHAEVEAIRDAAQRLKTRDLSGCVLYTNGGHPCPMCTTASHWANLDRIFYATTPAAIVDAGRPPYQKC